MNETVIDFLRHGRPAGGRRYRGQIDDPLSDRGWEEMWRAVSTPAPWQQIISSPLVRCSAFARALAEKLQLPYREDPRLKEVGFGGWEGKTGDELKQQDPAILTRFYHDPVGHLPEHAEPLADFRGRVAEAFEELLVSHCNQHLLVVAHAGVIRAVITHVMGAPVGAMYRISIPTASLARIRTNAERPPTLLFTGLQQL